MNHICRFLRCDDGPTAVEYAVMLSLVLMVAIAAISAVGLNTKSLWTTIVNQLTAYGF
jgi:pilus assembly protein Flp/PilA